MERWPAPDAAQFLRLWTRKEAHLKAKSRGLSVAPSEVDACDWNGAIWRWDARSQRWRRDEEWRVEALDCFSDCLAALAAQGRNWTVVRHEL